MKLEDVGLSFYVSGQQSRLLVPDQTDFHIYYDGQQIARVYTFTWGVVINLAISRVITYVTQFTDSRQRPSPIEVLGMVYAQLSGRGVPTGVSPLFMEDMAALLASDNIEP